MVVYPARYSQGRGPLRAEGYLDYCVKAGRWSDTKYSAMDENYVKTALAHLLDTSLLKGRLKPSETRFLTDQCREITHGVSAIQARPKAIDVLGFPLQDFTTHFHYYDMIPIDSIVAAGADMHKMVQIDPGALSPGRAHVKFEIVDAPADVAEREFLAELTRQTGVEIDATTAGVWQIKNSPVRTLRHD